MLEECGEFIFVYIFTRLLIMRSQATRSQRCASTTTPGDTSLSRLKDKYTSSDDDLSAYSFSADVTDVSNT